MSRNDVPSCANTQLAEPTAIVRKDRRITFEWLVKEDEPHGEPRRHLACLNVTHQRAGCNMFSGRQHGNCYMASLGHETEARSLLGGVARGYRLFSALAILTENAGRFSPKQFERFADEALSKLRERYEARDERVLSYFDPAGEGPS
jgi:hypothetical protein